MLSTIIRILVFQVAANLRCQFDVFAFVPVSFTKLNTSADKTLPIFLVEVERLVLSP